MRDHLDVVPSYEEVQEAVGHLKSHKAAGESGILPELLMCGCSMITEKFVELFDFVWQAGCVARDWRNALIVPIPKKVTLSYVMIVTPQQSDSYSKIKVDDPWYHALIR